MEINLPPNNITKVDIAQSNLMTIFVDDNNNIFYSEGSEKTTTKIDFSALLNFFKSHAQQNSKLVILLKFDRKSKYHMMVDVIDQLNVAELNRFSIAPLTDADKTALAKAI
jgi:biopolymer transport protein ExbD